MGIIAWIILGLLAGWIASMIMGTNARQNMMADIILGVLGAVVGGFIVNLGGGLGITGFNFYSLMVAVLGAVLLIGARRMFTH
jgi:uncharacterized membrane protein YeaQ/YmgE (transglycosylase-associated protein family)